MTKQPFGVCECGKWGPAPSSFDERRHFLQCVCKKLMYLSFGNPKDLAYSDSKLVTPVVVLQSKFRDA